MHRREGVGSHCMSRQVDSDAERAGQALLPREMAAKRQAGNPRVSPKGTEVKLSGNESGAGGRWKTPPGTLKMWESGVYAEISEQEKNKVQAAHEEIRCGSSLWPEQRQEDGMSPVPHEGQLCVGPEASTRPE